jgi:hypothetical protein
MSQKGEVVRIPRLPRIPTAPRCGGSNRQETFERIAEGLERAVETEMRVAVASTRRGFPAASVDLGRLQGELEAGLEHFDMKLVRQRWKEDVSSWMVRLLMSWVQRVKMIRFRRGKEGIHIRLETQDDWGYYLYEFDVFPSRARKTKREPS